MNETQTESLPTPVESTQATGIARRRLLRAGLAAAPVVLAVSGRSAMAGTSCGAVKGLSPLAWASMAPNGDCVGTSHTITGHTCGKSPGYWKPNCNGSAQTFQPDYKWPVAPCDKLKTLVFGSVYQSRSWSSYPYTSFKGVASNDAGFANGAKFRSVFTSSSDSRSFSRILIDESAAGNIEWHFCAAYLNCKAVAGYPVTEAELKYLYENKRLVSGGKQLTDGQIKEFLNQTWT